MTSVSPIARLSADSRWIVVVVHLAILAVPPVIASVGLLGEPGSGYPALALLAGLGILGLQVRHGLAIAGGTRPRAALVSVLALVVLVYLPLPLLGWNWIPQQACVMASAPLVLRDRLAAAACVAPVVGTAIAVLISNREEPAFDVGYAMAYTTFALAVIAATLWGSARLVAVLHELRRTRGELAALAVTGERLRVSRDLHDLLGQSLSAISLKGDLAVRLLPHDPAGARAEVQGLTRAARDALRGIRAITRDELTVELRAEIDGAAALTAAAHIATTVQVDLPSDLPPAVESALAWALREAVTNMLRHSRATTCSITLGSRDGTGYLTVVNDGTSTVGPHGHGLTGLTERVHALSGSVTAGPTNRGEFTLAVALPLEAG